MSVTCRTSVGALLWISETGNRLLNSLQSPAMLGVVGLTVQSVIVTGNTLSVTSDATISDFQIFMNGLFLKCRETTTSFENNVTFLTASKLS